MNRNTVIMNVEQHLNVLEIKDAHISHLVMAIEEKDLNTELFRGHLANFVLIVFATCLPVLGLYITAPHYSRTPLLWLWYFAVVIFLAVYGFMYWHKNIYQYEEENIVCCCQRQSMAMHFTMHRYETEIEEAVAQGAYIDTDSMVHPIRQIFNGKVRQHEINEYLQGEDDDESYTN